MTGARAKDVHNVLCEVSYTRSDCNRVSVCLCVWCCRTPHKECDIQTLLIVPVLLSQLCVCVCVCF